MGKCTGLKGGGHHRKAIDIADKKRNEKKQKKKNAEMAGKRYLALQEILTGKLGSQFQDCDVYLEATTSDDNNADGISTTELCKAYFRYDDCSNRRCKFSHEYTIADALQNVTSGSNSNEQEDDNDNSPTIPALQYLPGIIGSSMNRKRRHINRWKQPSKDSSSRDGTVEDGISSISLESTHQMVSSLENVLLEGSTVVNTIVSYLPSNQDVLNFGLSCRYLHKVVLLDGSSNDSIEEGCQDVVQRKQQYNYIKLHKRNEMLLKSKAIGGRLRYVVGYVMDTNKSKGNKKKNKGKTKNNQRDTTTSSQRMRPLLIYDCENPHVFSAFREGASVSSND